MLRSVEQCVWALGMYTVIVILLGGVGLARARSPVGRAPGVRSGYLMVGDTARPPGFTVDHPPAGVRGQRPICRAAVYVLQSSILPACWS